MTICFSSDKREAILPPNPPSDAELNKRVKLHRWLYDLCWLYREDQERLSHINTLHKIEPGSTEIELSKEIDTLFRALYESKELLYRKIDATESSFQQNCVRYGDKYACYLKLKAHFQRLALPDVKFPPHCAISGKEMLSFIETLYPEFRKHWDKAVEAYREAGDEGLKNRKVKIALAEIKEVIWILFFRTETIEILQERFKKDFTPIQESPFIRVSAPMHELDCALHTEITRMTPKGIAHAICWVLRSYFSKEVMANLVSAGKEPFASMPTLSLFFQEFVGEAPGEERTSSDLSCSVVITSNDISYARNESFRTMQIQAILGQEKDDTGKLNTGADTIQLLHSSSKPGSLYVLYETSAKAKRLIPVIGNWSDKDNIEIQEVDNHKELVNKPALDQEILERLFNLALHTERFFEGEPMEIKAIVDKGKIYLLQVSPVKPPPLAPAEAQPQKKIEVDSSHNIKDILALMSAAEANSIALGQLNTLRRHRTIWSLSARIDVIEQENDKKNSYILATISKAAREVEQQLTKAFEEAEASFSDQRRGPMERSFHVKTLSKILLAKNVRPPHLHSIRSLEPLLEGAEAVIDYYSNHINGKMTASFANQISFGECLPQLDVEATWKRFITKISTEPGLENAKAAFINQISSLKKENPNLLSLWLTFYFADIEKRFPANEALSQLLYSDQELFSLVQFQQLSSASNTITYWLGRFSKEKFERALEIFDKSINSFFNEGFLQAYRECPPRIVPMMVNFLYDILELFDSCIQEMKNSKAIDENEKSRRYALMLRTLYKLMKTWISPFGDRENEYFRMYFYYFENSLSECSKQGGADQLIDSRDFDPNLVNISRHHEIAYHKPATLEDCYNLIYNNLLLCLNIKVCAILNEKMENSYIHTKIKSLVKEIGNALDSQSEQNKLHLTDMLITSDGGFLLYDLIEKSWSASFKISFEKLNPKITLMMTLYTSSKEERETLEKILAMYAQLGIMPAVIHSKNSQYKLTIIWKDDTDISPILSLFTRLREHDWYLSSCFKKHPELFDSLWESREFFFSQIENISNCSAICAPFCERMAAEAKDDPEIMKILTANPALLMQTNNLNLMQETLQQLINLIDGSKKPSAFCEEFSHLESCLSKQEKIEEIGLKCALIGVKIKKKMIASMAKKLLEILNQKGWGHKETLDLAANQLYDFSKDPFYNDYLQFFSLVLENPHALDAVLEIAIDNFISWNVKLQHRAASIFRLLFRKNIGIKEALRLAQSILARTSHREEQENALALLVFLVDSGYCCQEALKAVQAFIKRVTVPLPHKTSSLLLALVKKENALIEECAALATRELPPDNEDTFELFLILAQCGYAHEEAKAAAIKGIHPSCSLEAAIKLLLFFVQRGECIAEAIEAAARLSEIRNFHRDVGLDFFYELVKLGHGLPEAAKAAGEQTLNLDFFNSVWISTEQILDFFLRKGDIQPALDFFCNTFKSGNPKPNDLTLYACSTILEELSSHTHAVSSIAKQASTLLTSHKKQDIALGAHLFYNLFKHGKGYDEAVPAVYEALELQEDPYPLSLEHLLEFLLERGYGIPEAKSLVEKKGILVEGSRDLIKLKKRFSSNTPSLKQMKKAIPPSFESLMKAMKKNLEGDLYCTDLYLKDNVGCIWFASKYMGYTTSFALSFQTSSQEMILSMTLNNLPKEKGNSEEQIAKICAMAPLTIPRRSRQELTFSWKIADPEKCSTLVEEIRDILLQFLPLIANVHSK